MLRLRGTEQLRAQRTSLPVTDNNSPNSTHSSGGKVRECFHPSTFIIYCLISVFVVFRLVYLFGDHPFPQCVCVSVSRSSVYFCFSSLMLAKLRSRYVSLLLLWIFGCFHGKVAGSCCDRAGSVCAWSYQSSRFSFWRFIFYLRRKTDCGSGRSLREICPFHVSP